MAYTEDKKPAGLSTLTSLATDDTFIVGDTSDTSETVKTITKANLLTDFGSSFAALSHTHTASQITDFDTEVSNNTDVAANTAARHSAVTVTDSAEIDFTLTGQNITASLIAGSIDESKLDASVNASLDLADSASQPGHTHAISDVTSLQTSLDAKAPIDNPTFTTRINTPIARATTSAGLLIEAANATDVVDFGIGNTANTTFYGAVQVPDDAYDATSWNGNATVPTKNAIRDKIESLVSGSGITRSVTVTSGSVTAGSSTNTDYVYMVAGAHTISLPSATSNTNLYTIKNNHSANITVDTVGAETIDGTASISLAPEESVQIISNGTNYFIV